MTETHLKAVQLVVDKHISQFEEGYFQPLSLLARMTEEVGELAREVNHLYGQKRKRSDEKENTIAHELSDILFIVLCFANSLDVDMDVAFAEMMTKYETRDKDRWTLKT